MLLTNTSSKLTYTFLSIFVPILWSSTSLYLLSVLLPTPCATFNEPINKTAIVLAILNIVSALAITGGLIFAKYNSQWKVKTALLNGAIGLCFLLATANFFLALVAFSSNSCGAKFAEQLHMYEEAGNDNLHIDKHYQNGSETSSAASRIINSFRYYDTKIAGLAQVLASVGQVTSAMILLVKQNDIKMYTLWRMGMLDSYIEDCHSHN